MTNMRIAAVAVTAILAASAASAASTYSASTAYNDAYGIHPDGHSLTLDGTLFDFLSDGAFTIDGTTATLTGTLSDGAGNGFIVDMSFNLFTGPEAKLELDDSAYVDNGGPVDPSTWSFWDLIEGGVSTILGYGGYLGLDYDVISKPINEMMAFQSGYGANGKNIGFGLSGWLFLDGRTEFSDLLNPCPVPTSGMGNTCDFNVDLTPVPLPASALLLIGGVAALGGLRRSRRKEV